MAQNNESNQGNDNAAIGTGLALIGAGFLVFFLLIYALLLFGAFVFSILCLCAWNTPLTLGTWRLEPGEARAFIGRGLAGAFILPAFVIFCDLVFRVGINGDYLIHFVLGGYALGSLGVALLVAANEDETGSTIQPLPEPPPPAQITPPKDFIRSTPAPFRFASWDDEEDRP